MTAVDDVRYWRHPAVSGVHLLRAHYVNHGFGRHSHDTFVLGVATTGVEELWLGGQVHRVRPGGLVMINPGVVHTGRPADEGGWAYRVFYPDVDVVAEVAGTPNPWFTEQVVYDADAAAALVAAHRAAESADPLAAGSLLGHALSTLLRAYGGERSPVPAGGGRDVEAAREILHERLAEPPSLAELAAEVGTGQFALLRAFRARHGLPPHAYLNQLRVRRACALLDQGTPVARAAVEVGFTDQSHLARHFRRIVGVPPGHYRRKNVQDRP
ncbi:AraC family transcriptional regulator [Umezawaea sp.]|uniref:AraC family transcriptional regulator n=1 Tax=Umezawaea sp. TaxID=1955258 RepID=UPI002ED38E98